MKIAILYLSETGNTKTIAEELYIECSKFEKEIKDIKEMSSVPEADMYFICFPVHNQSCEIEVMNLLENMESANIAFFVTCGVSPEEKYKNKIERSIEPWLNDSCTYHGMFLCQGASSEGFRNFLNKSYPDIEAEKIESIIESGHGHPDDDDFDALSCFVSEILDKF